VIRRDRSLVRWDVVVDALGAPPAIAFDGDAYLVVFESRSGLAMFRVSEEGMLLDRAPRVAAPPATRTSIAVSGGREHLAVWREATTTDDVHCCESRVAALRLTQFGDAAGQPIVLAARGFVSAPQVATDGDGFLVAWSRNADPRAGSDHGEIVVARIDRSGRIVAGPQAIAAADEDMFLQSAVWDGTHYALLWSEGSRLMAALLGRDAREIVRGELLPPAASNRGATLFARAGRPVLLYARTVSSDDFGTSWRAFARELVSVPVRSRVARK
jgi:hypothetical protein